MEIGAQAEDIGDVHFVDMKFADNGKAGINVIRAELAKTASVENILIVGVS
jgi:hypothetical protein